MIKTAQAIVPLLGDLADVPAEYIRQVAQTKRVLERWTMDPSFRAAFAADPEAAIQGLGVCLDPEQVLPFLGGDAGSVAGLHRVVGEGEYPLSVLRYRAFVQEKLAHRATWRAESEPSHPRMAAWRSRQMNRCRAELGTERSSAILHAPVCIELSKGCTVGCWFCGVAAPRFDHNWGYTPQTAALWRETLAAVRAVIGDGARQGFLYWATDPLDNPDYERFLTGFHEVIGRCPQTTTAQPHKDPERTRELLRLSRALGSPLDRFSIIALNALDRVHAAFTPEELLRVELLPQNREAGPVYRKSAAGRARRFAAKRAGELTGPEESATIACVSGFLINMVDRSVQLITPCNASDNWPLGYWVLDRGSFGSGAELTDLLQTMIETKMRATLRPDDRVRLHRDIRLEAGPDGLRALSRGPAVVVGGQPDTAELAALISAGTSTARDIALRRRQASGVPLAGTLSLLGHLFAEGILDEEPPAPWPGSGTGPGPVIASTDPSADPQKGGEKK
jgi:radical SAM family RiPP maturation amino acid epimerase